MIEDQITFTISKDNLSDLSKFVRQAQQLLDPDYVAVFWHTSDVQERYELTTEQARQVLHQISGRKHDANVGINWDVIDAAVLTLFPDATPWRSDVNDDNE